MSKTTEPTKGAPEDPKRPSEWTTRMREVAQIFKLVVEDVPRWLRPPAAVLFGLFLLAMSIVTMPLFLVRALKGSRGDPVELLRAEVESTWVRESPQQGLAIARRVHRELLARGSDIMWRRRQVGAYGRM